MATYQLIYSDDEFGVGRRIEFDAADPFMALTIAQYESEGRTAELWEGERKLCTLRRTGPSGSIWEVGPCKSERAIPVSVATLARNSA